MAQGTQTTPTRAANVSEYDRWIDSLGLPIHRGFYVEDARTVSVGHWKPARYLAFHTPPGTAGYDAERATDQIEYPDEDPMIRRTFEEALAKRGLASLMPDGAYRDRAFEWSYGAYDDGA